MNPQNFTPVKPNKPIEKNTPNILNTLLAVILVLTVVVLAVVLFFLIQKKINSTSQPVETPTKTLQEEKSKQPTPTDQPVEEVNAESTDSGSLTPARAR